MFFTSHAVTVAVIQIGIAKGRNDNIILMYILIKIIKKKVTYNTFNNKLCLTLKRAANL